MGPLFKTFLKIVVVGWLIAIGVAIFNHPCITTKVINLEIVESISTTTVQPKNADQIDKNFTCQYDSQGVITQRHRISKEGLLKEVDEVDVQNESIFFIETSCSADLNSRQSCAVESAARENPEKQVYVLFISPVANLGPDGGLNMLKLKSIYANINFLYADIVNYTKGTKLEKWVEKQTLATSSFKVSHLSDALRILTLYKFGGIYFDLDVVVMHSFQNMSNFAGEQSVDYLNGALISMKANGTLVNACIDEFVNDYRGDIWGHNGPDLMQRVIRKTCERVTRKTWKNCDGDFTIYPPNTFYPIPYEKWNLYFEKTDEKKLDELFGESLAVHLWNKLSEKSKVQVGANIIYGDIASKYCPLSYWNAGKFF